MRPRRPLSQRVRRTLQIATMLVVCALVYGLVLVRFDVAEEPGEQQFGVSANEARIALYLQPMAVDPVNETMQMRISVLPARSTGDAPITVADRDLVLLVNRSGNTERVQIRANQPFPEATFSFDLNDGSIRDYPLESYVSPIHLACFELGQEGKGTALPTHVTSWEGVLGFGVHGQEVATPRAGELQLRFIVNRTGAVEFFGLLAYCGMIVLAVCALTIGTLVFVGIRRVEVTLVGALGAIVFALPAIRNALPGAPPLGVRADVLVFFWAELAAVIALSLFIAAWARRGAQP